MYLLIAVVLVAVLVGVGLVTLLDRRRVRIPDYADPDVEEVAVEDLLSDAGTVSPSANGQRSADPASSDAVSHPGRWDRLG